jgi:alkylation response protein AidB-like acyl-CoA dehydrogenase
MDLELNDDQKELRAIAQQFLAERVPFSVARTFLEGGGSSQELWQEIRSLGWLGVALDADDPFGLPGLCIIAEQCGRHAAPTLLVDTVVAARIASTAVAAPSPVRLAEAEVALAMIEPADEWSFSDVSTRVALAQDGSYRLNGTKVAVAHARHAPWLAVLAMLDDAPVVAWVRMPSPGCTILDQPGLDPGLRAGRVEFADVVIAADEISMVDAGLEPALAIGAVATAAEGLGAASRALDEAIAYALDRRQFGRPIGSFQALQHLMADAHIARETAWSSVLYAAAALEEHRPDALEAAAIAKAYASGAMRTVVEAALQVLGGIAFTWEHDVHLLQRRVLTCEHKFGDAIHHEQVLARRLAERALQLSPS